MAKKPKARGNKKSTSSPNKATSTPISRHVILERIEEQQRVVIESVTMTREALERKIGDLKHKLSSKIEVLAIAGRKNSADIQGISEKLDTKADASRVSALERIEALESPAS